MKKNIVILTGAGMSAESGLKTFRDSDGLWENHSIEEVCTPLALATNRSLVLKFYNERRAQLLKAKPNQGHLDLAKLEQQHNIQIITQNVDNLHEQAGSTNIMHLHGELMKVRSMGDANLIYPLTKDNYITKMEDRCEKGYGLRPHIVFFGEDVPMIEPATKLCEKADILVIIGTSMNVYPAASLISYIRTSCPIYFIDPKPNIVEEKYPQLHIIKECATTGVQKLTEILSQ